MDSMESEGKTVTDAVEAALKRLGLRRDQVEVEILQEGSSGFIGIGVRPAKVRLTEKRWGQAGGPARPKPAAGPRQSAPAAAARRPPAAPRAAAEPSPEAPVDPQKACALSEGCVREILELMGLAAPGVSSRWDAEQERVKVSVESPDAGRLLSGDGRALESIQFLATLIVHRKLGGSAAVQVDAQGYWEKREKDVLAQAQRGVEQVRATGKPIRLEPMDSPMRRLVHRALAALSDVETASEGEGAWRKIVIRPRRG